MGGGYKNTSYRNRSVGHGLNLSGSGQARVAGSFEHGTVYRVSKKMRGISWLPKERLAARKRMTLLHELSYFTIRCISARLFRSIIPLAPGPLQWSVPFRYSYQRSAHHLPLPCFPVQQRSSAASSTSSQFLNQDTQLRATRPCSGRTERQQWNRRESYEQLRNLPDVVYRALPSHVKVADNSSSRQSRPGRS